MNKINICPVCEYPKSVSVPDYNEHFLVKCKSCNFVYSKQKPTKEELDEVYDNYDYSMENSSPTSASIKKYKDICNYLMSLGKISSVLDIGCGKGAWLNIFKEFGCNTFGTEYNDDLKTFASSIGHTMLDGGLFPIVKKDQKFDLIIFTEVIEHIQNPNEVLSYFNSILSNNGLIFITTPNFSAIERHFLRGKWKNVMYPEHLSYYTPATLNHVLKKNGYSKISLYTENISIFVILESLGFSSNAQNSVSCGMQAATTKSKVLSTVKILINKLLNMTGTGTSIKAIYKKQGLSNQAT
jgi:2-polyprenyl-3-methyl-5-hydroxy-6-metoxy-1,4-benzoquinol methylase